jgi:hypothetical protein
MIKTTYNPNESAYRQAELDYVKAHGASEEQSRQEGFSPLKAYSLVQRIAGGGELNPELEQLLEKVHACEGSDFADFVREHSASIVKKVREYNAQNSGKSDFMKHYKLVNRIGGIEL